MLGLPDLLNLLVAEIRRLQWQDQSSAQLWSHAEYSVFWKRL
jgi:hypothetical protein